MPAMFARACVVGCAAISLFLPGCGGGDEENSSYTAKVREAKAISDPKVRARELVKVGLHQHDGKDVSGAERTFVDARAACDEIQDPLDKAEELAALAQAYGRTGKKPAASGLAVEIERLISGAKPASAVKYQTKATALVFLGRAYQTIDQPNDAASCMKKASAVADELQPAHVGGDEIQLARAKSEIYSTAAAGFASIGQQDQARQTLEEALASASSIAEQNTQAVTLAHVAAAQRSYDADGAVETFDAAAAAARAVMDEYERVFAMAEVAEIMRKNGQGAKAGDLLNAAQAITENMRKLDLKKEAQERIQQARG
jgi:tetratricopeptide (TPR) repeat protein